MMYEQLKEMIKFCDSITSKKLIEMLNNNGFIAKPNSLMFIEVVKIVNDCVYVLFLDQDKMSTTYDEEGMIMFTWDNGVIKNLDFVQQN